MPSKKRVREEISIGPNRAKPVRFHEMADDDFEEMCNALIEKEPKVNTANRHKRPRQPQFGIDIVAQSNDNETRYVASCKCYEKVRKGDMQKFSDEFLDHWEAYWKNRNVTKFILCLAASIQSGEREAEIEIEKKRFIKYGLIYEVWGPRTLQEKIRPFRGLAHHYLGEPIANLICGPQPVPTIDNSPNPVIIGALSDKVKALLSKSANEQLEKARELSREGKVAEAQTLVNGVYQTEDDWKELDKKTKSTIIRYQGLLALRADDLERAEHLSKKADKLNINDELFLQVQIIYQRDGAMAALTALGRSISVEGIRLNAALHISLQRYKDAIKILNRIPNAEEDAESKRLLAICYMFLSRREEAIETIGSAESEKPHWLSVCKTAGIIRYFCAFSPISKFHLGAWPLPMPSGLQFMGKESIDNLKEACATFDKLLPKVEEIQEKCSLMLWKAACYVAIDENKLPKAKELIKRVLAKDNYHIGALIWCQALQIEFDNKAVIDHFLDIEKKKQASLNEVLFLIAHQCNIGNAQYAKLLLRENESLFIGSEALLVYRYWSALIEALVSKKRNRLRSNPSATLPVAIQTFYKTKKTKYLESLMDASLVKPIECYEILWAFANEGKWKAVNKRKSFLINRIQTSEAWRLAIIAQFNIRNYRGSLKLIKEFQERFKGESLPKEIKRIEVLSAEELGEIAHAHKKSFELALETRSPQDIIEHINAATKLGDMTTALPLIEGLLIDPSVSIGQKLSLARIVKPSNPRLHQKAVQEILKQEIPDELIAMVLQEGMLANLDGELGPLFGKMQEVAIDPSRKQVQTLSIEEIKEHIESQLAAWNTKRDMYLSGESPIHLLFDKNWTGFVGQYWNAFESNSEQSQKEMLGVLHGNNSRSQNAGNREIESKDFSIVLDTPSLFVAHGLGLIAQLEKLDKPFWIPSLTQNILQTMENDLKNGQPKRNSDLAQIVDYVNGKKLRIHVEQGLNQNSQTIVFSDDFQEKNGAFLNLKGFAEELLRIGVVDTKEFESMRGALGYQSDDEAIGKLENGDTLVFKYNTIELVVASGILPNLFSFFKLEIQEDYFKDIQQELSQVDIKGRIVLWVRELRSQLTELIRKGKCKLLPKYKKKKNGIKTFENGLGYSILEIVGIENKHQKLLWIDDRFLNRHESIEGMPIIGVVGFLDRILNQGLIGEVHYFKALLKLRKANAMFIPIAAQEIVYYLKNATIVNDVIVETTSLKVLRVYFSKALDLEVSMNLEEQNEQNAALISGEASFLILCFKLIEDVLRDIWMNRNLAPKLRIAWSNYVWNAFRIERFKRLPVKNPSEEEKRGLYAMKIASLFGVLTFSLMNESSKKEFTSWIYSKTLKEMETADSAFIELVIERIQRQWLSMLNSNIRDTISEEARPYIKAGILGAAQSLPSRLRNKILNDKAFMQAIGSQSEMVLNFGRGSFNSEMFWEAAQKAMENGTASLVAIDKSDWNLVRSVANAATGVASVKINSPDGESLVLHDPFFNVIDATNTSEELAKLLIRDGSIDQSLEESIREVEGIRNGASLQMQYHLLDEARENSVRYRLIKISNYIEDESNTPWEYLAIPNCVSGARYLRLGKSNLPLNESFEYAADQLLSDFDPMEAFRRMAKVPREVPEIIVSRLIEMHEKAEINLVDFLSLNSGGIIYQAHCLKLVIERREHLGLSEQTIISKAQYLIEGWQKRKFLYLAILNWSERIVKSRLDYSEIGEDQCLAVSWMYAEEIFGIFSRSEIINIDGAAQLFTILDRNKIPKSLINVTKRPICAEKIEGLTWQLLLLQVFGYVFADSSIFRMLMPLLLKTKEEESKISFDEFGFFAFHQSRGNAEQRIGTLFEEPSHDIWSRLWGGPKDKNPMGLPLDIVDQILGDAEEKPHDSWLRLFFCGIEWLSIEDLEKTRKRLSGLDIVEELKQNSEGDKSWFLKFFDYSLRQNNSEIQIEIENKAISIATYFNNEYDSGNRSSIDYQYAFCRDIVLACSKDPELKVAIKTFCRLSSEVCKCFPSIIPFWRNVCEAFLKELSFDDREPVWDLFTELRVKG